MPQTVTVRAKGLYLTGSDFQAPDGAMAQADNVVISRDGIVETRRGMEIRATKALARLFPYKDALVGHNGASGLSRSADSGATWTDYGASVTPPSGYPVRAAASASNLYLTDQVRPKRIDALTGTPEEAGVPGALDVELALSSAGSPTAMATDTQVAYRVLFGKKDANGRLLLGAPSSRGTIANATGGARDVTVGYSLPQGLDSSHFVQGYRTTASASATTDPGDEMGLVYEGSIPQQRTITQLARATNVVTATSTAHGYAAGAIVRVAPGGTIGAHAVALGAAYSRSTDNGATWSASGITGLSGTITGACYATKYVAVGISSVAVYSADGLTWSSGTGVPAASYRGVAYGGTRYVAAGDAGKAMSSTDGQAWSSVTMPTDQGATIDWKGIAYNGSQFAAVGTYSYSGKLWGAIATSADGTSWTILGNRENAEHWGVAWHIDRWVVVGHNTLSNVAIIGTWASGVSEYSSLPTSGGTLRAVASNGSAVIVAGVGQDALYSATARYGSWFTSTGGSTAIYGAAWDGTKFIKVGTNVAYTSADGQTWAASSGLAAGAYYATTAGGVTFSAGEKTIASVPTADTFTYAETGGDGTLAQSQTATPITGAFLDTVPDGFLGAALYTNENQEGILQANDRPPLARELATFRESVFYANITTPAQAIVYLLAAGGSNGLADDDTVTINGVVYTAKSAESISARQFKRYTAGSISENVRDTALSLVRVVNRSLSSGATLVYLSGPDDAPGQIEVRNTAPSGSLTVAFSRTTAWSPTTVSESPKTYGNGVAWSKTSQPDHVAKALTLSPVLVGSADKEILRNIPTRSSSFLLKEDGIWRITGDAGNFTIDPFDPTIRVVGAETAVQLDNTIFALSEQGVVRISDTGVAVVSRPIEAALLPLLAPAMRATTKALAFGVAYESDRKYVLWLPTSSSDTKATQAYVYDLFTGAWTRRTDDYSHAIVNPADDRIYAVDGTSVWQERKTLDDTDLADQSYAVTVSSGGSTSTPTLADATNAAVGDIIAQGAVYAVITAKNGNTLTLDRSAPMPNGAATIYKAIPTVVKWAPKFGASPAALSELQEVALLWDRVYFAAATLGFSSNLSPAETTLTLNGSDYAWTGAAVEQAEIRAWPPLEKAWGSQFNISLTHSQAWSPNAVSGLVITYKSPSGVISR